MTREFVIQMLSILKANYPISFQNWNKDMQENYIEIWLNGLQEYEEWEIKEAVLHFIYDTDERYAANVGMIRSYIRKTPDYLRKKKLKKYDVASYNQLKYQKTKQIGYNDPQANWEELKKSMGGK